MSFYKTNPGLNRDSEGRHSKRHNLKTGGRKHSTRKGRIYNCAKFGAPIINSRSKMAARSREKNGEIILNEDSDVDDELVTDIIGEEEYKVLFASDDDMEGF